MTAAALALGACGGDDDSGDGATATGPTQPAAEDGNRSASKGKDDRGGSGRGGRGGDGSGSHPERRFRGIQRSTYEISRSVCGTQRESDAALRYRAKSKRPEDIARAYVEITYKIPRLRRPGYEGCLAGLRGR
jgi:hypothetical protein